MVPGKVVDFCHCITLNLSSVVAELKPFCRSLSLYFHLYYTQVLYTKKLLWSTTQPKSFRALSTALRCPQDEVENSSASQSSPCNGWLQAYIKPHFSLLMTTMLTHLNISSLNSTGTSQNFLSMPVPWLMLNTPFGPTQPYCLI